MTLSPESRVLLTDALRPPAGYAVDLAVGTSYSLDLMSLLLAPMSFAVNDRLAGRDQEVMDPVRLLEAARRYADRTTVFCQLGAMHVPRRFTSILTFIEDGVVEATAPQEGALFHPKVWALRYKSADGSFLHRAVILSRNLTQDRSWDTALVLDEEADASIDASPLADFITRLPGLAFRDPGAERRGQIDDLASTLRGVRLAPPAPFTSGELLPIGVSEQPVWPFPDAAQRLLAISPFLGRPALERLGRLAPQRTLLSRLETLELMGSKALTGWDPHVLQRLAEVEAGEDLDDVERGFGEGARLSEGLHAKTYVADLGDGESLTVTGSANLTFAPWGRNVEFGAALHGPTAHCGVEAVLTGGGTGQGLAAIMEGVTVPHPDGATDAHIDLSYELEALHRAIAARALTIEVAPGDEPGQVTATLWAETDGLDLGDTMVWLASLPQQQVRWEGTPAWTISREHLTPFVAMESTAGGGDSAVVRRCLVKAELRGDVGDRRSEALASVLRTPQDVLRYLVFLLGDPAYDALAAELAGAEGAAAWGDSRGASFDVALFEPMVRATGRNEEALARIASTVADIKASPAGADLLPDGFEELWDVVWQVHTERSR